MNLIKYFDYTKLNKIDEKYKQIEAQKIALHKAKKLGHLEKTLAKMTIVKHDEKLESDSEIEEVFDSDEDV